MVRRLCGLAALLALAVVPGSAEAQLPGPQLEIEPYLGVYVPGTDIVEEQILGVDVSLGHQSSFALGGRLTVWLFGPLGLEGNFMYAFSDVEIQAAGLSVVQDEGAYVWAADARLLLNLLPLGPIGLHVGGGIATIQRGGDFYDVVSEGKDDVGGVVGAGLRVKLPGLVGLRADADAYFYSAEITAAIEDVSVPQEFGNEFQADFVLSAGLFFAIGP